MSLSDISVTSQSAAEIAADALVLAVSKVDDRVVVLGGESLPGEARSALEGMFEGLGFGGTKDEVQRVGPIAGIQSHVVILVGLGASEATPDALRYAAGAATRRVRGFETVALGLPVTSVADARAILEGAAMGAYDYTEYRFSTMEGRSRAASSLVLTTAFEDAESAVVPARETARAVALVRDLVNAAPLDLYPETFAEEARRAAGELPVDLKVWDVPALEAEGFGGIVGVGQGSTRGPRLVRVSYQPSGASRHLALVGKGITFDSGGLSLKPPASMIGMKDDMTGAATVLAVALAAAALALPVRITAWLCLAENMPSGSAIRPGDVLKIYGGKTVEVLNTDAEGRLVLADGLVAASEEHPDAIIDVATLTGAQVTALGNRYVGVMGENDLVASVLASATSTSETLWHMPMPAELRPLLNSDIADLQNIKPGNTAGGMLIAAIFLREFVGQKADGSGPIPWTHLDIAGPALNGGEGYGFTGKGPTGVTVRTLIDLAERMSTEGA
ncbi:leucyl aminopeptidase [Subtercola boreus]|uniref:Probable cytosol aminopeptidase n=1 Tax=Subtercola boreus TaxID=120213 RepID=A0A3E0VYK0_9MICO|nr:leucyl aminopeptidase [Subtercola boreus]RFA14820.1 leucyl aminopeptidase [Subtercola boreus]